MTATSARPSQQLLNKVPAITAFFWIIKVLATTVGESAADFLSINLGFGLTSTSLIMAAVLSVVLVVQVRMRRYVPVVYWIAVVLLSIVGTLITDNLVDNFRISLEATTLAFSIALAGTFVAWYLAEHTLAISTIFTRRRELFYWAAILFTFALGTAGGDLLAEGLALGYGVAALLFGGAIAVVAVAHFRFGLNAVFAFWVAYILTRPLGASLGDLLAQPTDKGGIGWGTFATSLVFLAAIAGLIAYLSAHPEKERVKESSSSSH